MSRAHASQKPPQAGQDLTDFPSVKKLPTRSYRAHAKTNGVGYFASDTGGRFNLADPKGTNYFADDVHTAVRERLGELVSEGQAIFEDVADAMVVTAVALPRGLTFANVTHKDAALHHITRELCAGIDYTTYQLWAAAFDAAGFAGVRYASRFTTDPGPNAWALFGTAGADKTLVEQPAHSMDGVSACEEAKVPVLRRAAKAAFTVLS